MSEIPLGKKVRYDSEYDPEILFTIAREENRKTLAAHVNFFGLDIWNCYEISWLNMKQIPEIRVLEIYIPSESTYIVESKSLKLYLNSLNESMFTNEDEILALIKRDLEKKLKCEIKCVFRNMKYFHSKALSGWNARNIDNETAVRIHSAPDHKIIQIENPEIVKENLYSDVVKSNCLITNQPDWASVYISYEGPKINHASLLSYIISFRKHNEFHEHCVERIFTDISIATHPQKLTVYARYTRRGGIDINPIRSSERIDEYEKLNIRLARQ